MFYKLECYIEVERPCRGEQVASDISMELACMRTVKDHVVVSGKCTAKEARCAGLHRTTSKEQNV